MNREWKDASGRVWVILDVRRERNGVVEYLIISRDEITWRPRWSGSCQ